MTDEEIYQSLISHGLEQEARRFAELCDITYPGNCAIYVRDMPSGRIHRLGDDQHDSIYVDEGGSVHYHNLQNGDGCGPGSAKAVEEDGYGYYFLESNFGEIYDEDLRKQWEAENG